jgi:hypothetical protein
MDNSNYYVELASIEKLNSLLKTKKKVDDLVEQLGASLSWLIHYSEKHNIPLPEKNKILSLISHTLDISENIPSIKRSMDADQPKGNKDNNYRRGNSTCLWVLSNLRLVPSPVNFRLMKYS